MIKFVGILTLGIVAISATLYSGMMHGRIRHASGLGVDLSGQVQALVDLPEEICPEIGGESTWNLVEGPSELDEEVVGILECKGYYQAKYRSADEQFEVSVLVLVGPSGPTSLHRPEVCYPAQAFKHVEGPDRLPINPQKGKSGALWVSTFKSPKLAGQKVRVAYGWTMDGRWQAPKNSRREFAGQPFLFKVQLFTSASSEYDFKTQPDPIELFAKDFFPVFERQLLGR